MCIERNGLLRRVSSRLVHLRVASLVLAEIESGRAKLERTKYDDLPNFIPDNVDHLHDNVYDSQKYQHHDQTILRSFFAYAKLPL